MNHTSQFDSEASHQRFAGVAQSGLEPTPYKRETQVQILTPAPDLPRYVNGRDYLPYKQGMRVQLPNAAPSWAEVM